MRLDFFVECSGQRSRPDQGFSSYSAAMLLLMSSSTFGFVLNQSIVLSFV